MSQHDESCNDGGLWQPGHRNTQTAVEQFKRDAEAKNPVFASIGKRVSLLKELARLDLMAVKTRTPRQTVYEALDGERAYQDSLGPDRVEPSERPHSTGEYLTMLATYLRRAQDAWTLNPGDKEALHNVRKLGAICVRCMEDNGAPERPGFERKTFNAVKTGTKL